MRRGHACCYVQNPQSSVSTDRDHLSLDWLPLFQSTAYPEKTHCFDRKKPFMPAVSFASLMPLGDATIRHELLGFVEIWKVADLNLTDLHPKLRTVNNDQIPIDIQITCRSTDALINLRKTRLLGAIPTDILSDRNYGIVSRFIWHFI